ncbi:MAG: tetratricopeptide repeat protein [Planctomycetota bacterium]
MNDWLDAERHVERAHELYELGQWDEAESELRTALSLNPFQPEWHFNLGLTLEAAGRHLDAAKAFEDAHGLAESESSPHVNAGSTGDVNAAVMVAANLIRADRPGRALTWLDRAEQADPSNVDIYVNRVAALGDLKRYDEAEIAFYLGQERDPEHAELYATMADCLLARRNYDKAVWCLREAARLAPDLQGIQARLAEAYAATGRHERARQLYIRELRSNPGDTDTLLDLGDLLADMNRPGEAAEKYGRVLELVPESADAHFALAELAVRAHRHDDAITRFDIVLRLDPAFPLIRQRLVEVLLDRDRPGDTARARELLRDQAERFRADDASHDLDDLDDLAHLLLDADMAEFALPFFRELVARRPLDAASRHNLAVALFQLGQTTEAMDLSREALRFDERFVPAMHNLALAHVRRHEWLHARYWLRKAAHLQPDDPHLRRLRLALIMATARIAGIAVGRAAFGVARFAYGLLARPAR